MYTVRIEHRVPSYEGWKQAFDSDPAGRQKAGVVRYQISRSIDDLNHVVIDLDFLQREQAEGFLAAMRDVWGRVQGSIIEAPQARIVERVEIREY